MSQSPALQRTKLLLPGTCAVPKQPQRRARGGKEHLSSSLQQKGSPLLLDQKHQSMLCSCHGLMCFPRARWAQVAEESEFSLHWWEGRREGFLQGEEQISLLIIQWGLRGQRPQVSLCHLLLMLRASVAAPRAAVQLPALPPNATCLPSSTISAEKIQHPERRRGESFTQINRLSDYVSKTVLGGVCYIPRGLLSVTRMLNYGKWRMLPQSSCHFLMRLFLHRSETLTQLVDIILTNKHQSIWNLMNAGKPPTWTIISMLMMIYVCMDRANRHGN